MWDIDTEAAGCFFAIVIGAIVAIGTVIGGVAFWAFNR